MQKLKSWKEDVTSLYDIFFRQNHLFLIFYLIKFFYSIDPEMEKKYTSQLPYRLNVVFSGCLSYPEFSCDMMTPQILHILVW